MFPRRFASPNFSYCSQLHHNAAARKSTLCKLLIYKSLVGASGFEPEASCAQGRRATRLRYAPTRLSLDFTAVCDFVDAVQRSDCTKTVPARGWRVCPASHPNRAFNSQQLAGTTKIG